MQIIVHGGAGSDPEAPADRQSVLDEAAAAGVEADAPLAAVCAAVRVLEVHPAFNAGVGGAVQSDGTVRTDAGVMTGDGRTGAVAGLGGVANAVDVARAVATETPHVLLAGAPAVAFAAELGVETDVDLWTDETREQWADTASVPDTLAEQIAWVREHFGTGVAGDRQREAAEADEAAASAGSAGADDRDHDTVGAVATDGASVAAATSTGGRWAALAGRVGDVPQVGGGFFASAAGGASATGAGEDIARAGLARRAVTLLEQGAAADRAAAIAIDEFDATASGTAGVIVASTAGGLGTARSSPAMATARHT